MLDRDAIQFMCLETVKLLKCKPYAGIGVRRIGSEHGLAALYIDDGDGDGTGAVYTPHFNQVYHF